MNQKTVRQMRKYLGYHPRKPKRHYLEMVHKEARLIPKYQIHEDGTIKMAYDKVDSIQIMYKDEQRKQYKALKKRYINPNCNDMTFYKFTDPKEDNNDTSNSTS